MDDFFDWLDDCSTKVEKANTKNLFIKKPELDAYNALIKSASLKNKKEENEEMRTEEVVKLYYNRKRKALRDDLDESEKNIYENDANQKYAENLKDMIRNYISDNEIDENSVSYYVTLPLSKESDETLDRVTSNIAERESKIREEEKEVKAMLSACDTYDAEIAVLKTYGIIGEDGKISK